ncbi:MAG TPA: phenylacetate--CoA ligase PaaK [Actinomycetales bacterium]|nr:phenylacetate--CoA ligase PaaK [Actinomycetales bacterium]
MTQTALPAIEPRPDLLDPAETMSIDELRQLQLARLQDVLQRVYDNVPHYRSAFDNIGVHPGDCKTLEDLRHFPTTTKADLRANYPFGLFAVPRQQVARLHASSGTTGQPTVVGYTRGDLDRWAGLVARSIRAAGGRPGDVAHVAYGYGLFTGGLGAHYGAEALGCTVVPISGGMTERQVRLIQDFRPRIIMVTPSYFLAILDEMEHQGIDPASTSLEVGVFGAEPWTDKMRAEIESRAGMHAVDIYGLSEVMGPGVAQECVETKDGLHIWEDHFFPEILDPITGDPVPDGEVGELVFTTLTREAMPVIRYRTRDLTRLEPGTARPMFRRMGRITGRSDDMMIIRGVNVFPTQIEEETLLVEGLSPHFVCVLRRPGRMDEMVVRVEARESVPTDSYQALARDLSGRVKRNIGVTTGVEVVPPGTLERSVGKIKRIIDERHIS